MFEEKANSFGTSDNCLFLFLKAFARRKYSLSLLCLVAPLYLLCTGSVCKQLLIWIPASFFHLLNAPLLKPAVRSDFNGFALCIKLFTAFTVQVLMWEALLVARQLGIRAALHFPLVSLASASLPFLSHHQTWSADGEVCAYR